MAASPGVGGGPFYKTPDEARWSNWLRSLLVFEDGPILKLGSGIPRAWLAHGRHVSLSTWPPLRNRFVLVDILH